MVDDLIKHDSNLVSVIQNTEFGEFVKPMIREIRLFDSFIAGTTHLVDKSPLETVAVGDELTMQREDNPHDRHAIMILNAEKKKLGYVPKKDNLVFARLMDAGKILKAKITKIEERRKFKFIRLEIFLVDL